jgi:hypothetical protein
MLIGDLVSVSDARARDLPSKEDVASTYHYTTGYLRLFPDNIAKECAEYYEQEEGSVSVHRWA